MKIFKIGTPVITVSGSVRGIITAVSIRGDGGQYQSHEVSYFQNGEYKCVWLMSFEFNPDVSNKKKAGFKDYEKKDETIYLIDVKTIEI